MSCLSMSLLCDYSDSSASDAEDDEHHSVAAVVEEELPSVDALFSSSSSSVLSASAGSVLTGDAVKRRAAGDPKDSEAKRPRTEPTAVADSNSQRSETAKAPKPSKHFAPPQLKRPNVSTEDLGAWNTQKTMQHHERKQRPSTS